MSVIGTTELVLTNEDGSFSITTDADLPIQLNINYPGFYPEEIIVTDTEEIKVQLRLAPVLLEEEKSTHTSAHSRDDRVVSESVEIAVMDSRVGMSRSTPKRRGEPASMESMPAPPRRVKGEAVNTSAGQLTAAEWNDLHNWQDWKDLLANQDYNDMQAHWQLYPRTRYSVFLRNSY